MTQDHTRIGIAIAALAYALFAMHDAVIKLLVETIPVWQVLFFRSAAIFIAALAIGRRPLLERAITTPFKRALLGRGLITLTAWLCYYTAARSLPLAQLLSLYFAAPLLVTVLAIPLLGEAVTRARWSAVLVGFVGVLLASDPLGVPASLPTLMVLIAAALWGYAIILMRKIARREKSLLQMLTLNGVFLIATGTACIGTWQPPTLREWMMLLGVGIIGGLAQFCVFEAARFAPAAVQATVEYTALVWAFILGFLIWGDIPPVAVFAGAGLILLAGVLLLATERRAPRVDAVPARRTP